MNLLVISGAVAFGVYQALRLPPDINPRPLRRAAEAICHLARVPLVVFGHTHEEVLFPLDEGRGDVGATPRAWYINSGNWIAVFTHDVLLPREQVQFSFVDIEGHDAKLMHWSPMRGDEVPVILLDEREGAPAIEA